MADPVPVPVIPERPKRRPIRHAESGGEDAEKRSDNSGSEPPEDPVLPPVPKTRPHRQPVSPPQLATRKSQEEAETAAAVEDKNERSGTESSNASVSVPDSEVSELEPKASELGDLGGEVDNKSEVETCEKAAVETIEKEPAEPLNDKLVEVSETPEVDSPKSEENLLADKSPSNSESETSGKQPADDDIEDPEPKTSNKEETPAKTSSRSPPVPKKPSSKIAAFQQMFQQEQPGKSLQPKEQTGPKAGGFSSNRANFAQNLNGMIALPGMAQMTPSLAKKLGLSTQTDEAEDISSATKQDAAVPIVPPRNRKTKGPHKRLPKSVSSIEKVERTSAFNISVTKSWSIEFKPQKEKNTIMPTQEGSLDYSQQSPEPEIETTTKDPESSAEPAEPTEPTEPAASAEPVQSTEPVEPVKPIDSAAAADAETEAEVKEELSTIETREQVPEDQKVPESPQEPEIHPRDAINDEVNPETTATEFIADVYGDETETDTELDSAASTPVV